MPYQFAGFFARPMIAKPLEIPTDAVWRSIENPFVGVGVRLESLVGKSTSENEVRVLSEKLGLDKAEQWLYIAYDCWAGNIDFVYGIYFKDGVLSEPVEESDSEVESVYADLMAHFGVSSEDAFQFEPFERGFWDEA